MGRHVHFRASKLLARLISKIPDENGGSMTIKNCLSLMDTEISQVEGRRVYLIECCENMNDI